MSLDTLEQLYNASLDTLRNADLPAFRNLQRIISDCMMDMGDESAFILQLPWECFLIDNRNTIERYQTQYQTATHTPFSNIVEEIQDQQQTLVFDVPIPNDAKKHYVSIKTRYRTTNTASNLGHRANRIDGIDIAFKGHAKKLLTSKDARRLCNRTRFAGFPPYGLRFLGLNPRNNAQWRFTWTTQRHDYNTAFPSRVLYADDVIQGGYSRLFHDPSYTVTWRDDWQNYEYSNPYYGQLFDNPRHVCDDDDRG